MLALKRRMSLTTRKIAATLMTIKETTRTKVCKMVTLMMKLTKRKTIQSLLYHPARKTNKIRRSVNTRRFKTHHSLSMSTATQMTQVRSRAVQRAWTSRFTQHLRLIHRFRGVLLTRRENTLKSRQI